MGLIVDIHDQLIIHELHCAWISIFSLGLTVKHCGALRRYLGFTLLHMCVCVSTGQWHPFVFALYISAMHRKVSKGCGIIEIHEALPSDLSIEQRGAVRDGG